MRKPRKTTILLMAMIAVLGVNRHLRSQVHSDFRQDLMGKRSVAVSDGLPSFIESGPTEFSPRASLPVEIPQFIFSGTEHAARLSADANALVSEMCTLHLLADNSDLSLTPQEWSSFATVVLEIQAIRQNYEAQIAISRKMAPGQYRLEIPAYASAGDLLREKFHAELRTELGDAKAADVLAKLGGRLEGHFAGFGVSVQTLDIAGNPGGSLNDVEVTRTVTYWNSVEGRDALTTRREVHFPAYEDPTGEGLSALLAMVKA